MSDFNVRSDSVDVEQVMHQIRARIREKRGVDYTEDEIRELANVKLERFIDPKGVRSDLLKQYQQARNAKLPGNYRFEETTLYDTHRGLVAFIRKLLRPVLKLFFNPNPLIDALHIQSQINESYLTSEPLQFEIMHNLVIELTRTSIEVKNLKMRLESMASRLDFDERRARALEGVVQYRPGSAAPQALPTGQPPSPPERNAFDHEGGERRSRRRRRRGRRRGSDTRGSAGDVRSGGAETAPEQPSGADDDRGSDFGHRAADPAPPSGSEPPTES